MIYLSAKSNIISHGQGFGACKFKVLAYLRPVMRSMVYYVD